jgi:hypothetical protein
MKKCNCKQAAKLEGEKIVLKLNSNFKESILCFLCGSEVRPDGFDFFIEVTKDFVCMKCAKEKAPDLYLIHESAHQWAEASLEEAFDRGVACGKTAAGQMILDALDEPPLERVKRVCRTDLGARSCDEMPF